MNEDGGAAFGGGGGGVYGGGSAGTRKVRGRKRGIGRRCIVGRERRHVAVELTGGGAVEDIAATRGGLGRRHVESPRSVLDLGGRRTGWDIGLVWN